MLRIFCCSFVHICMYLPWPVLQLCHFVTRVSRYAWPMGGFLRWITQKVLKWSRLPLANGGEGGGCLCKRSMLWRPHKRYPSQSDKREIISTKGQLLNETYSISVNSVYVYFLFSWVLYRGVGVLLCPYRPFADAIKICSLAPHGPHELNGYDIDSI